MRRISRSVAEEVLRLHDSELDPSEIALKLDLKKMQVCAIIAHRSLESESETNAFGEVKDLIDDENGSSDSVELRRSTLVQDYSAGVEPLSEEVPLDEEGSKIDGDGEKDSGVFVGEDKEYGDPLYWCPQDSTVVPNPHLMIIGESGSGKTYALQCLMAELKQREMPSIVFDYGQGFEIQSLDETFRKYTNPQEYLLGEEGISLNPLQIFANDIHGPKSVATRVSDIFDSVYQLGAIQRKVLIEAILRVFERSGITAEVKSSWIKPAPSVTSLQEVLDELASDKEYPNAKNAVGIAARLTTFFMLSSFHVGESGWSWETLINDSEHRVHILQFRGLEGKTQRVLVEVLLWHLFFYLKSHGQGQLRLYCILDEAHHLSFREGGPIDLLLREARKFGVGIIFASQQPEDFSPSAFSNSASKLVFQTTDTNMKVARFLAAKCTNYDSPERIHELIAVLPRGEAFFITQNRGYEVQIADLRKRSTLWSNE
jgi:DNA phosphorothioation-dependent restriction protein DptH